MADYTGKDGTGSDVNGEGGIKQNVQYRPLQIKILAATWLAYAGYYLCRKPFYIAKVSISDSLHFDTIHLAHLGTAFLAAYMLGQFSSALFGKKLGPKLLLIAGIAVSIISTAAFGMSNGYWTFMLLISINGLAQGTGWPGCIGSLAFWFRRKERGSVLGVWSTCYQAGAVAATVMASLLLDRAGWRWSFFGGSIALLGVWFLVMLLHPGRPEDAGLPPLEDEGGDQGRPDPGKTGWNRSIIATIVLMGLIYFCIKFLRYALWSWLPWLLNRNFFMTEASAGYLSTVFDICGLAGVIIGVLYYQGSTSIFIFTAAIGISGFMLFGPDSLLSGVGAIDAGSKQGALNAAGIINGMGSIGPIFQEQVIGWMYERFHHSLLPILLLLVFIAAVSALLAFALFLRSRRGLANV
jgi:sugar phosphate permease